MAGLYLHIPFCKRACHYCNFYFSTSLGQKGAMVAAICRELEIQKDYLGGGPLGSIYFGGGTPSLLEINELEQIFSQIERTHGWLPDAEITLEANPDDLSFEKLKALRESTPVNRLSIGVQSFFEEDLEWMNRAHSAAEARASIENAARAGFDNLTIDLIYGSPTTSDDRWEENLDTALGYPIDHLSCYALTVEEGTALHSFIQKKKAAPPDEARAARQFERLVERAEGAGFEHYEISNFAKNGRRARHNSAYWLGEKYLGVGPAAHSFDQKSRQWNVANNALYLKSMAENKLPFEREELTATMRYNEYVMTRLRTVWGCVPGEMAAIGAEFVQHFSKNIGPWLAGGQAVFDGEKYLLTKPGKLMADRVAMELFFDD